MSFKNAIWGKLLVKAFYREHAGFFLFVFLVFFGVVQPSTQLYFHYVLIRGILETPAFMALVFLAWALYGLRVRRSILQTLAAPDALFLYKANALPPQKLAIQCIKTSAALLAPVIGYASIIVAIGIVRKENVQAFVVLGYVGLLVVGMAWEMRRRIEYPGCAPGGRFQNPAGATAILRRVPYWSILLRFLLIENKGVTAAAKIFSVGMLYLLLRLQTPEDYDLRMPFLAYSIALFGHGILLFRCRRLETTRLLWYRGLPVNGISRATQYALFGITLLLPEMILLAWLDRKSVV